MGAFEVRIDDGREIDVVRLEQSFYSLYIPTMVWARQLRFSSGGICLVMASYIHTMKPSMLEIMNIFGSKNWCLKAMMVPFLDLKGINAAYRDELIAAATRVIDSDGIFKGGVQGIEEEFSRYRNTFLHWSWQRP